MSFHFPAGADVTILVSKNAGRYRLQSDAIEAIWLVSAFGCGFVTSHASKAHGCKHLVLLMGSVGEAGGAPGCIKQ